MLTDEFASVEGITGTTTDVVMRTFKTSYDWSRDLLDEHGVDPSFVSAGAGPRPARRGRETALSESDLRLMQLLSRRRPAHVRRPRAGPST